MSTMNDRIQSLIPPPPFSLDTLNKVERMPMLQLCQIGRDITQEISLRLINILTTIRVQNERRILPQQDIKLILAYTKFLFRKLEEIRVRIDIIRAQKATPELTADRFYDDITSTQPAQQTAAAGQSTLNALVEQFESNKVRIAELSNKVKRLEWYATAVDPSLQ